MVVSVNRVENNRRGISASPYIPGRLRQRFHFRKKFPHSNDSSWTMSKPAWVHRIVEASCRQACGQSPLEASEVVRVTTSHARTIFVDFWARFLTNCIGSDVLMRKLHADDINEKWFHKPGPDLAGLKNFFHFIRKIWKWDSRHCSV